MSTSSNHSLGRPLLSWGLVVVLLCGLGMAISAVNAGKTKLANFSQQIDRLTGEKETLSETGRKLEEAVQTLGDTKVSLTVDLGKTREELEQTQGALQMKSEEAMVLSGRLKKVDAELAESAAEQ